MSTLYGGYDALRACQFISGVDGFIVVDGQHLLPPAFRQIGVHGSDARIIESGRYGESLFYLPVGILHHQCSCSVNNAFGSAMYGGCGVVGVYSVSAGLCQHNLHAVIVYEVVYCSGGIAAPSHAGYEIIGIVSARFLLQLPLNLLRYNALQLCHNVGVGVWPHGRAHDVERFLRVAAPVSDSLGARVAERHVARCDGMHLSSQHLHALHVGVLPLYVGLTHKHFALHIHQCAHRSRSNAVLSGARLARDTRLTHLLGHEYLSHGVVYFMSSRVVQVLPFQV